MLVYILWSFFYFAADGKNSQLHGANKKHTHTISNTHGEVFKEQVEIQGVSKRDLQYHVHERYRVSVHAPRVPHSTVGRR
jgi:hypothetical protein